MARPEKQRIALAKLELLLAISTTALVVQLVPGGWQVVTAIVDVGNWSSSTRLVVTAGILATLVGVRFVPQLHEDWRNRRLESAAKQEKRNQQLAAKAERERLEAIRRSRRMY